MTELQAINRMLALAGEPPVNTLTTSIPEVIQALEVLSVVSSEVQTIGWHFNTDEAIKLTPADDGTIAVPTNAIRIDATDTDLDIVVRAGKLYDKKTHSNTFSEPLEADIVWLFPFADLPLVARHYIALRATRRFLREHLGSGSGDSQLAQDEQMAYLRLQDADGANADYNMLEGNPETLRASLREL